MMMPSVEEVAVLIPWDVPKDEVENLTLATLFPRKVHDLPTEAEEPTLWNEAAALNLWTLFPRTTGGSLEEVAAPTLWDEAEALLSVVLPPRTTDGPAPAVLTPWDVPLDLPKDGAENLIAVPGVLKKMSKSAQKGQTASMFAQVAVAG
ncbi:MAG: hypothetical protein GY847_41345 [Proteobacteria bacterium]|nr:hypothetical protein [Pseudomonadota bacterium]